MILLTERVLRITIQVKEELQNCRNMQKNSGLGDTSGMEIPESDPQISDDNSVLSAIGQGTNNYTTSQLARYITAVANKGTVYNLSLLDKVTNPKERQ